jgi:lysophospholipase L1-like esterase
MFDEPQHCSTAARQNCSTKIVCLERSAPQVKRSSNLYHFFIALLSALCAMLFINPEVHAMQKPKHIVLLGASVGNTWNIESLPDRLIKSGSSPLAPDASRLAVSQYRFEYVGEYQFDKTNALQQILKRKENKPDAIFIKECAAYFPGDLSHYQELLKGWIKQCKESKVVPIPTTVVPVIEPDFSNLKLKLKDTIKWVLGRPTLSSRLEGLIKYNDWIKSYGQREGLIILDLEAPLRISEKDRSLKIELHSGDGLHLNQKAYSLLDQIVLPTLDQALRNDKRKK